MSTVLAHEFARRLEQCTLVSTLRRVYVARSFSVFSLLRGTQLALNEEQAEERMKVLPIVRKDRVGPNRPNMGLGTAEEFAYALGWARRFSGRGI